jgi:hypothetical protein
MDELMHGIAPPKIKNYDSAAELLAKLEGRAALWERHARDATDRAAEFESAAQRIRNGASTVTVGRTTYTLE